MTEREKMVNSMLYNPSDNELQALRKRIRNMAIEYNRTTEDEMDKRIELLGEMFGAHGKNYYVEPPIRFDYGVNTSVGENFFANFNLTILDVGKVTIGDNVMFGPNVTIATPVHPLLPEDRNVRIDVNGETYDYEYSKPVTIGNNVWIASNVVINGGVTIGDGAVIGSGSVVTRDIPAGVIAAGVPCRVIRKLTLEDKMNMPE